MLVLSRKLGEKIVIGDDIVITVVKIEGGQVRLGFEAPREVPVRRKELPPEGRKKGNSGFLRIFLKSAGEIVQ